jgi:hypothetical protein
LHVVFELHYYLEEHAERSRLNGRRERSVRNLGAPDCLRRWVFSSGCSDDCEKQ